MHLEGIRDNKGSNSLICSEIRKDTTSSPVQRQEDEQFFCRKASGKIRVELDSLALHRKVIIKATQQTKCWFRTNKKMSLDY